MNLRVGTRASALALIQTRDALRRLRELFPQLNFEEVLLETPGDRDLESDLRQAPSDFFTRDLDDAVRNKVVNLAIHSAKDLPTEVADDLDWFWLPWCEDQRDAWVLAAGGTLSELPADPVIGVSSDRRAEYAVRRFPAARLHSVRGSIVQRLEQLDHGYFDAVIMAGAAIIRLGLCDRVTEWIPRGELDVPPGQGYLAVTFAKNDERMCALRRYFVKAVRFVSAGVGSADYCTCGGISDLQAADICLYDVLMDDALLKHLPAKAERIFVGKRCGAHSLQQSSITKMIADYARAGRRVVRLKGGDAGLFGRLAEETALLDELDIPYHVRAGVSALAVATTATGMLLTRRGVSRGFCALTPRAAEGEVTGIAFETRAALPLVLFMSIKVAPSMAQQLLAEGWAESTPAAVVFNAGGDDQRVVSLSLAELQDEPPELKDSAPGLLVIGSAAKSLFKQKRGVLQSRRVLLTCSEGIIEKAVRAVIDCGGVPIAMPMIQLRPCEQTAARLAALRDYEWVALTSPASARIFMHAVLDAGVDLRQLPRIMTCGAGTCAALAPFGIRPDITPPMIYSAAGLIDALQDTNFEGVRVLRLRSEIAGTLLADVLRELGAQVDDVILYRNHHVEYQKIPDFDIVFFASASAVESFTAQHNPGTLADKYVLAIGEPTSDYLEERGIRCDCVAERATVEGAIDTLARRFTLPSG